MVRLARTFFAAVAILFAIPVAGAGSAEAASVVSNPVAPSQPVIPQIHALDCTGGTGSFEYGPGFRWEDGWRGMGCYPC